MALTPQQQGIRNVARYMLAVAILDAQKDFYDFECPEEEPGAFLSSQWGEVVCDIAQMDPLYVRSLIPRSATPVYAPLRMIEVITPSGLHANIVSSCDAASLIARCPPGEVYRALRSGRSRLSSGWSVRYREEQ